MVAGSRSQKQKQKVAKEVQPIDSADSGDEDGENVTVQKVLSGEGAEQSDEWKPIETKTLKNPTNTGFFRLETLGANEYEIVNGQLIMKGTQSKAVDKAVNETTESDSQASENRKTMTSEEKAKKRKKKSNTEEKQKTLTEKGKSSKSDNKKQKIGNSSRSSEKKSSEPMSASDSENAASDEEDGSEVVVQRDLTCEDDDSNWSLVETNALKNPKDTGFFRLDTLPGDLYTVENGQLIINNDTSTAGKKDTDEKKKKEKKSTAAKVEKEGKGSESDVSEEAESISEDDVKTGTEEWQVYDFHSDILRGIKKLGFASPTPIQKLAIPAIVRKGKDVLACAETGSGKTLAFGLPILNSLRMDFPEKGSPLSALILTPTRELAVQVADHLRQVTSSWDTKHTPRIATLVGGMALPKQVRVLNQCPEIVVATPGRLNALMEDEEHPHLAHLDTSLRFLAIDEADRMLDRGHFPDLKPLVAKLTKAKQAKKGEVRAHLEFRKWKRQTLLFSATLLTNQGDQRKKLKASALPTKKSKKHMRNKAKQRSPIVHLMEQIGLRGEPQVCFVEKPTGEGSESGAASGKAAHQLTLPAGLKLRQIDCPEQDKDVFLYYLLSLYRGRTLVFVNTIASLKRLAAVLQHLQVPNLVTLHANMKQKQRLRHLERFRSASSGVMIASDVAARGLDIPGVDHVVHHGVPTNVEVFLHRSGRTARARTQGLSLALVAPTDLRTFLMCCRAIHDTHGGAAEERGITPQGLETFAVERTHMGLIRDRVRVAKQLYKVASRFSNRRMDREWLEKNAEANDMVLDTALGDLDREDRENLDAKERRDMKRLRGELKALLGERLAVGSRGNAYGSGFVTANHDLVHGGLVGHGVGLGMLDPQRLLEIAQGSSGPPPKASRKRKSHADPHTEQLELELQRRVKRKAKRGRKGLRM